jgi:phosphate starvation-inducible PhoH-like protein
MPRKKAAVKKQTAKTRTNTDWNLEKQPNTVEDIIKNIRLSIKPQSQNQKKLLDSIRDKEITICSGSPGVGKTFLSCAEALNILKTSDTIDKIVIIKSVTTLPSEQIGYVKGSVEDKMEGIIYSFTNNFEKLIGKDKTSKLMELGVIQTLPIAFLRGINIDSAIVICDEVQNITIPNIRTIMTRLGKNSKMVFLGDVNQIDIKDKKESALQFLINNFNDIDEIGIVELTVDDIVRNPLIKKIEDKFNSLKK